MTQLTSWHDRKFLPVMGAETALQAFDVQDAAFDQRDGEGGIRFADRDGWIADTDVCIVIMGGSPEGESVRVLLDD